MNAANQIRTEIMELGQRHAAKSRVYRVSANGLVRPCCYPSAAPKSEKSAGCANILSTTFAYFVFLATFARTRFAGG
jgi:hypothetical protein